MSDRAAFLELVRDALGHLHNRAALRTHALAAALARGGVPLGGDELQQALLDAISSLRPVESGRQPGPDWRRYRYLWLRYVEGSDLTEIARTLGVTDRQARRDHREAVEAVAAALWTRYVGGDWDESDRADADALEAADASDVLRTELARMASSLPPGPTALADSVAEVLRTAARMLERHGLEVRVEVPSDLPMVMTNEVILRQALLYALAHLVERGAAGSISITAERADGEIALVLAAGLGRPASDASTESGEPIELARQMLARARAQLSEEADAGSIRLLVRLGAAAVTTVLVVDDNLDFLRLCQRALEGHAYRVLVASLPDEALRLARTVRPDVIVLDVLMPQNDGWALLAELQNDACTRDVPVIVCSVFREPHLARELGAKEFLPKPVTPLSLLAALERVRPPRPGDPASPATSPSAPPRSDRPAD